MFELVSPVLYVYVSNQKHIVTESVLMVVNLIVINVFDFSIF